MNKLKDFLPLLLFDSDCLLCNRLVQFVLHHQKTPVFFFAALQSPPGQLVRQHTTEAKLSDSLLLVTVIADSGPVVKSRSAAVWAVLARLKYPWRLLVIFKVVPAFIADRLYDLVAVSRYKIWGRAQHCLVPDPSDRHRFIDNI